ncbi:MAG: division/cell wall cluster transcriptional repressor MraZ, partial [Maribacter sp.]
IFSIKWYLVVNCGNNMYIFELLKQSRPILNNFFYGTYDCKADAKGRVMLPSLLRNQMNAVLNEGFVIKQSMTSNCLELYPISAWMAEMEQINQKSRHDDEVVDFKRKFTAGLRPVEVDATGRLLISKSLIETVGITKEVKVAALGNYIEIWDRPSYDEAIATTTDAAKALSKKVMLGKKPDEDVS